MHPQPTMIKDGRSARAYFRNGAPPFTQTTGMAPGYLQGSPVIVTSDVALEFLALCQRNMKPCPVIAISEVGASALPTLGDDIDVRTDLGGYRIWRNGKLADEVTDIRSIWRNDFVTFVIGCSYSFDSALLSGGLQLRHVDERKVAPMYRTNIPLIPAGRFHGTAYVSMRPFNAKDAIRAIEITSRFPMAHGTPLHIGDPSLIGVDLSNPLDCEPVSIRADDIPVFWGCGITPQHALLNAELDLAISHKPGCMLITDVLSSGDAMVVPQLAAI